MTKHIEHLRIRLDNEPMHTHFMVRREVLREAIAEVDALQSQHGVQCMNIRAMLTDLASLATERDQLREALARKAFEVQVLEMTQGALKMEIDRLRSEPAVSAVDATVTVARDGSITINAPMVAVTGNVEAR